MNIFPEILLHYGQLMLALLIFFLTGRLVRWRLGITDRFFAELFFSAFIGMTTWIALYAIIKSGGRTINMLWILPAAYFLYQYRPTRDTIRKPFLGFEITAHHVGAVLLGTLLCYGWEAYFFFWPGGPMKYHIPFWDSTFYTRVISALVTTGRESAWGIDMELSGGAYEGITLYHYYELWLNALLIEISQTPSLVLLMAVNVPLFHCFVLIGILAWLEKSYQIKWWLVIICFGLLFVNGVFLEWYKLHPFLALSEDIRSDLLDFIGKKTGPYYLYAIGFILLLQRKYYQDATVFMLSIAIVTTVALPTIAGGIMLGSLILWLLGKLHMKEWIWHTGMAIAALATVSIFFLLLGLRGVEAGGPSELLANVIPSNRQILQTKFNLFIGLFILVGILYWSWLIILALLGFKYRCIALHDYVITGAIVVTGAVNWALLSPNIDAFQFFIHPTFSLLNLFLILQFTALLIRPHVSLLRYGLAIIALFLLIGINFNRHYDTQKHYFTYDRPYDSEFLKRLTSSAVKSRINGWGVSILHANEYVKTFQSHLPIMVQMGEYLPLLHPTAQVFSISTFDVPEVPRLRHYDLKLMAFTQFVNRQQAEGTFQSIPQSQADFIRKHRMGYLIVSKSALVPPTIQPMITDSIVDSKSGERFYFLKP
jgi:hypothetical protein